MTPFFQTKKAAAILKHAILDKYLIPFASKTGKLSKGNRVGFVDGYAGEGRYEDGNEGSPALAMRTARDLSGRPATGRRNLECTFVEDDRKTFERLVVVVRDEQGTCVVTCLRGNVRDHLDTILVGVAEIPLFMFLDPFGVMIPLDGVVRAFELRPGGWGGLPTEVLINFNANGIRRIGGLLTTDKEADGKDATLGRMDAACGGNWWREMWLAAADKDAAEVEIVTEYARLIHTRTGCGGWMTPVRNRADLKPVYYLLFFTRHPDGWYLFGEALSSSLEVWRRAVLEQDLAGSMHDIDEIHSDREARLSVSWIEEIYANLKRLLVEGNAFVVSDKFTEVYGSAKGLARQKHLRAAWKQLHRDGITKTDSKGELHAKRIEPA